MKKKDEILLEDELEEEAPTAAASEEERENSAPDKPRKPKAVLVPKVQNMDNYLMKHYKDYIIQELNHRLADGDLDSIIDAPIKSERIVLDCALKEAYLGSILMNDHMTGDFPVLKPGMNAISWSGAVTKVVVRPNWRSL